MLDLDISAFLSGPALFAVVLKLLSSNDEPNFLKYRVNSVKISVDLCDVLFKLVNCEDIDSIFYSFKGSKIIIGLLRSVPTSAQAGIDFESSYNDTNIGCCKEGVCVGVHFGNKLLRI